MASRAASLSAGADVSTNPGASALTRIPWTMSSLAADLVRPRIAALAAE
jgi:hypothetical protein